MGFGPGREVYEGWAIMTLSDLRKMKAVLIVDEGRIARVQVGREVTVRPVGSTTTFTGRVERVAEKGADEFTHFENATKDLVGNANRQVFEVEVTLDKESEALRPGLRLDGEILVNRLENVLVIPRAALVTGDDGDVHNQYVRLASSVGPVRRPVKVLAEHGLLCAVEGLQEGDDVWLVEPNP